MYSVALLGAQRVVFGTFKKSEEGGTHGDEYTVDFLENSATATVCRTEVFIRENGEMVGHFIDATGKSKVVQTIWDIAGIKNRLSIGLVWVRQLFGAIQFH